MFFFYYQKKIAPYQKSKPQLVSKSAKKEKTIAHDRKFHCFFDHFNCEHIKIIIY